jgi:hypothetical protein
LEKPSTRNGIRLEWEHTQKNEEEANRRRSNNNRSKQELNN